MSKRVAVMLWASLWSIGCDGDPEVIPPGPSGPTTASFEALLPIFEAICDLSASCESTLGKTVHSAQTCKDSYREWLTCPALSANIDADDMPAFDSTAINTCVTALRAVPCNQLASQDGFPVSCENALEGMGQVGLGQSCASAGCDSATYCADPGPGTQECPVCATRLGQGEECSSNRDCQTDLYCADGVGPNPDTCEPLAANGTDCDADSNCESGTCNSAGECADPIALNDPCNDDADCADPYVCVNGTCDEHRDFTESCGDDNDCVVEAHCTSGTCVAKVQCNAPAGTLCDSNSNCAAGTYCDYSAGAPICTLLSNNGQPCDASSQCVDGHYCNSNTDECEPLVAADQPCEDFDSCVETAYCDIFAVNPSCEILQADGAVCTSSFQCASRYCDSINDRCGVMPACVMP